ncbi:MAG: phosphoenolpyruvate--protein phosphotransferase, partial [Pseudomonadota bacterium]
RREHRARFEKVRDPYLRERLHDLEDLDNRLLRVLAGSETVSVNGDASNPEILVARRLGPAELLEYGRSGLAGIVLEEVAASSHAAIVARGLGIPTVGGIEGLLTQVGRGDPIIVDGEQGSVHLRPDEDLLRAFETRRTLRGERQAVYEALRDKPAQTQDGQDVRLMLNAGLALDLDYLEKTGADGIGLFRTEFQFLMSDTLPKVGDQIALYRKVLEGAGGKPVYFRTLDLGGDKMLPNLNDSREENPALGWRSVRFALDHPGLFRRQLRALVRAADGRDLTLMFPMVTSAHEYRAARELLEKELAHSQSRQAGTPTSVKVGAMLETPAFAYALEDLRGEVDFVSIGTNDMMQFFNAADRMTPLVSERYPFASRPVMRFLKQVRDTCERLDIPVSICGEAASHPIRALCLIALGYHSLSMPAGGVGPVKKMIRSLDFSRLKSDFAALLAAPEPVLQSGVLELVDDYGIQLS